MWILAFAFTLIMLTLDASPQIFDDNGIPVVWAEQGGTAELPCKIPQHLQNKAVNMILWFKGQIGVPMYSVDSRGSTLTKAAHAALSSDLGRRSYFVTGPPTKLRITRVSRTDQGIFRCRIDFDDAPTVNHRVNLSLIVEPTTPQVFFSDGAEVMDIAGPFVEGHDILLTCIVTGGEPPPDVTWWLDGEYLGGSVSRTNNHVNNRLHITPVTRQLQGKQLICQAVCAEATTPIKKIVKLEIYLKPVNLKIVTGNEMMSAGKSKHLMCETEGSYPPANISWLIDDEPIRQAATMVTIGENNTRSTLTLRPEWEDDGKELKCKAENPKYPMFVLEEKRHLKVAFPPVVSVRISAESDPSMLKEGDTVRLICEIKANPYADIVLWYTGGGVFSRNTSHILILEKLTPAHAGEYSCFARNREGATRSKPVTISVKYAPVCKDGTHVTTIGVAPKKQIEIRCDVDALPAKEIKFSWTFNSSKEVLPIPTSWAKSMGPISVLPYTPITDRDFGTLACWASNSVGRQKRPCLIHVIKARLPGPPVRCAIQNETSDPLEVKCEPGDDGGLQQHFVLEVNEVGEVLPEELGDEAVGPPLYQLLNQYPRFIIQDLRPRRYYRIQVYAKNAVGRSEPFTMPGVQIVSSVEKLTRTDASRDKDRGLPTMWTFSLIGASALTVLSIILVAIVSVSLKCKKKTETVQSLPLNNFGPSVRIRYPDDHQEFHD